MNNMRKIPFVPKNAAVSGSSLFWPRKLLPPFAIDYQLRPNSKIKIEKEERKRERKEKKREKEGEKKRKKRGRKKRTKKEGKKILKKKKKREKRK
jgi:hypothetical protein